MELLPIALLEASSPSKAETFFGKIPFLGWMIARILQDRRFHPISITYKNLLSARDHDVVIEKWHEDERGDAVRLMRILAEELGWRPPQFLPGDPCLVALWAYEDGLDDVAAILRIEDEWGIKFTDEEVAVIYKLKLLDLVQLIKTKSQ